MDKENNVLNFNRYFLIFILALLVFAVAGAEANQQQPATGELEFKQAETKPMNMIGSRRRRLPPELKPITLNGVVYKELRQGNKLGYEQKGGFLVATDQKSNEMLWHVRVYQIQYIEGKETDVQEVFFTRMELLPGRTEILIENELGKQFVVNLETRSVTEK